MREIKFRALTAKHEMWAIGYLCREVVFTLDTAYSYAIDTNTIGQFTGIKDKNGVEIYEGDIMTHPEFEIGALQQISIANGCTYVGNWHCIGTNISLGEVIGNIYENSDLL